MSCDSDWFMKLIQRICSGLVVVGLVLGCGSKLPETAVVQGHVTVDGRAVTAGKIGFFPEHGVPAFGEIQSDGSYILTTFSPGDGAMLGPHRVTVQSVLIIQAQPDPQSFEEEIAQATTPQRRRPPVPLVQHRVPQRYEREQTSGLTAQVERGTNKIDFPLTSP